MGLNLTFTIVQFMIMSITNNLNEKSVDGKSN